MRRAERLGSLTAVRRSARRGNSSRRSAACSRTSRRIRTTASTSSSAREAALASISSSPSISICRAQFHNHGTPTRWRYGPAHVRRFDYYDRTDATFCEVADSLGPYAIASYGAAVVEKDRARFDQDHVLIDEAQDWTDAERDLLVAVYGSRRMVLADGLVQLIRRHTSCDWMRGVAKTERVVRHLGDSLRMQHNVAVYANAIARTLGFANWSVEPRRDLIGGRVVVLEGELDDAPALVRAFGAVAALGKVDPVDNLICVPHSEIVRTPDGARHAKLAAELLANGERVWTRAIR